MLNFLLVQALTSCFLPTPPLFPSVPAMFRDLVDAQNCGQVNPLAGLGAQQSEAAKLQAMKGGMPQQGMHPAQMMRTVLTARELPALPTLPMP